MRIQTLAARLIGALILGAVVIGSAAQPGDPAPLLARAREALGGDAVLSAITSLQIRASLRRTIGRSVESAVTVSWEQPDKFLHEDLRVNDLGPLGTARVTTRNGFNGDARIYEVIAPDMPFPPVLPEQTGPQTPMQLAAAEARRLLLQRQSFTRLMLPLLVASAPIYPLQFSLGDRITLDSGPADVVIAHGAEGFVVRLAFDAVTARPVLMTWHGPAAVMTSTTSVITTTTTVRVPAGQPPPSSGWMPPPPMPSSPGGVAPAATVEYRMAFTDYRTNDGVTWPRRITTRVGDKVQDEWRVNAYKLNPKISANTFRVRR